jgi:hypothetical protein
VTGATTPAFLLARARRMGPLRYSELPPLDPWLSAPELAGWEGETIDRWWQTLRRPDPYVVVEVGAGDGSRARQVLESGPECLTALRLVLVEPHMAAAHARILTVEPPAFLFPAGPPDPLDPEPELLPATGVGPLVTSLSELPVLDGPATVLAMGWLSRLPADHFEWRDNRWWEVRLAASASGGGLEEMLVPWEGSEPAAGAFESTRVVRPVAAIRWLVQALRIAPTGVLAVVDRWSGGGGSRPAVAFDQLAAVRPPLDRAPVPLSGELAVVTWRLG